MIAVNTTAGTASEITRFCIITDTSRHVKMAIVDWRVTPQIAINDPNLMVGMPPALTAATGMDALTHAIEAYVSTNANPLTDAAALMSITMVTQYLPKAVANGVYMKARDKDGFTDSISQVSHSITHPSDMSMRWHISSAVCTISRTVSATRSFSRMWKSST